MRKEPVPNASKKLKRKIVIIGRDEWFAGSMMLKGLVIETTVVTMFGMK